MTALTRLRNGLNVAVGVLLAVLIVRLCVQLFAGRPDNLFVALLLQLSTPLIAPLAVLDAAQPRFGAVLEISTLVLIGLLVSLLLLPPLIAAAARSLPPADAQDDG